MVRHTGEDFVDVESVAVALVLSFQAAGINCSELDAPEADRFSGYSDTPFGEQVFDIAMAEIEPVVEPDGITDDVGWKSVALIGIHQLILANVVVNLAVPVVE